MQQVINQEETILQEIIQGDLQILYNLLETVSEEIPQAYKDVKYGIKIKYHIQNNLQKIVEIRERQKIAILDGKIYPLEEWWEEEEERRKTARKALLEYYTQDQKPYKSR